MARKRRHRRPSWRNAWHDLRAVWPARRPTAQPKSAIDLAELEDRILMSATPLAPEPPEADVDVDLAGDSFAHTSPQAVSDEGLLLTTTVSKTTPDRSLEALRSELQGDVSFLFQDTSQESVEESLQRELVFVDTGVANYEQLLDELRGDRPDESRELEVYLLDSEQDGIAQISDILASHTDLDAVHLISHGTTGQIKLGNVWLNFDRLDGYAGEIAGWNQALRDGGDLLIYGCDLASTADGRSLVDALGELTGADVAASNDDTGHNRYGGDWELEYSTGEVGAAIAVGLDLQQTWDGLLQVVTVTTTEDRVDSDANLNSLVELAATPGSDGFVSLREAILAANNQSDADEIILLAGDYQLSLPGTGEDAAASGDLDILNPLTITGAGAGTTTIDGERIDRVFDLFADVTIADLTIEDGLTTDTGGGIRVGSTALLTLERSVVQNNESAEGGGIYNAGRLTLADVEVLNNVASPGTAEVGGGLKNTGTALLRQVLLTGNTAQDGGAIFNSGAAALLDIRNVTITNNTASASGGGIYTDRLATIVNSTIADNQAASGGGIFGFNAAGNADLLNTVIINNTGGNTNKLLTSSGYNIDSGNTAFSPTTGDQQNTDPNLAALADNGGFTRTRALNAGSAAIDAGDNLANPVTDQRGYQRDALADIGAFEYQAASSAQLWLSTDDAVAVAGGTPASWDKHDVVVFDDPGLGFEASFTATTTGTFSVPFGFSPTEDIAALHYVSAATTIGDPGTDFDLLAGDLLLVFNVSSPTTFGSVANVTHHDVLVYRPSTLNDYTSGTYFMLLDDPIDDGGVQELRAITLVEQDTIVGGTLLAEGTFLLAHAGEDSNVYSYTPTTVGSGTTSSDTGRLLLDGSELDIDKTVFGLELLETDVTIGGSPLFAGTLLMTLDDSNSINTSEENLAVEAEDVFALRIFETEQNTIPDTEVVATIFFDGSDVGLGGGSENLNALTLVNSVAGIVATDDSATTYLDTPVVVDVVGNDNDPEGDILSVVDFTLPADGTAVDNGNGTFTYTPDAGYLGSDSFDYVVTDGNDGTAHYWKLDGNGNDSVGSAHGTLNGTTTVTGHYGSALGFNETTDHVTIADFDYNSDFSLSFRFKVDDNSGSDFQYIYSHGALDDPNSLNVFLAESGTGALLGNMLHTSIRDVDDIPLAVALNVDISGLIGDGQWHTYTLTVQAGIGSIVYIDGVASATANRGTDALNPTTDVYFGTREDLDVDRFYGGELDSVQIHDRALLAQAASDLHGGGSASGTVSLTVTNTAPTLDTTPDLTLNPVNEDAGAPVGPVGTLISELVDFSGGGGHDNVSDPDPSPQTGIAVTAADTTDGNWFYSTDDGANWNALGSVATSNARLLAADSLTRLYFQPTADYDGTIPAAIAFHAWDQTTGSNGAFADASATGGTTSFSAESETAELTVTGFNDDPFNSGGLPTDLSATEDTATNIDLSLIDLTDVDAGSGLLRVTVSTSAGGTLQAPTVGGVTVGGAGTSTLTLDGTLDKLNSFLDATHIQFTGALNANGNDVDSLAIAVNDQGNSGVGGGIDVALGTVNIDIVDGVLTPRSEFLVNTTTGDSQETIAAGRGSHDAVAIDASGNSIVVWSSNNQDGSEWGVYGQRYDQNGVALGPEFRVNQTTADRQLWATVATAHNGNFVVVWSSDGQDGDGANDSNVYARLYAANGSPVSSEILVNSETTGTQQNAAVAMDADGDFVVVWEGEGTGDSNIGIFGQRFDSLGNAQGGPILINDLIQFGSQRDVDVAMDDNGNFVAIWDDVAGFHAHLYDSNGVPQGTQFTIDSDISAGNGAVAMTGDGDFVVVWRTTGGGDGDGRAVLARRYDATGTALENAFLVNTTTANDQTSPSVAVDDAGNYVVVWEGEGVGDTSGVFGQKFDSGSVAIGGEFRINQTVSGVQGNTSVAMLDLNNFVTVWSGNGVGDTAGVFAAHFGVVTNDDPTNSGGLPTDVTVTEDIATDIDLSQITIEDVDVATGTMTVTLTTASGGQLFAVTGGGVTVGGSGSGVLTLVGTKDNLNAFLDDPSKIQYQTALNAAGDDVDSITVEVNDQGNTGTGGGTDINFGSINVDSTAQNDDPTNSGVLPTDVTVTEDVATNIDLSQITIEDVDVATGSMTVTLTTATGGQLFAATSGGVTVGGSGTGVLTLAGTKDNLNAFLDDPTKIQYLTTLAGNDIDSIGVAINDQGNTGAGGGTDINLGSINVDSGAQNDDPTNSGGLPTDVTVTEDVATDIDLSLITIEDVDVATGNMTVTLTANSGGQLIAVTSGGVTVGGSGGGVLTLVGTKDNLNAFLDDPSKIQYQTALNVAGDNVDSITVEVNDQGNSGAGGGTDINFGSINVDSTAQNDDPTNSGGLPTDVAVTEDIATDIDLSQITIEDVDVATGSMTVTLTTASGGQLFAVTSGGVTVGGSGSGVLTLVGTKDNLNVFLDDPSKIQYQTALNAAGDDVDSITVEVNDQGNSGAGGGTDINFGSINVDSTAQNDDPTNSGGLPTDVTVTEDVATNIDLSQITIEDVDVATGSMTVTLTTASGGQLFAVTSGGVTVGGSGSGVLTLVGTKDNLNAFLDDPSKIQYQTALNAAGDDVDSITVEVNDQGNTGSGGGTDINFGSINVDSTAQNDDPTNSGGLPTDVLVTEGTISPVDLSAIDLSDIDVAAGNVTVRLSTSSGGTLFAAAGGGVTVGGSGTNVLVLDGSLANLNLFLNNPTALGYQSLPLVSGNNVDAITIVVNDNGNTGIGGGGDVVLGLVNVDITSIAPSLTGVELGALSFVENSPATPITNSLVVTDVDDVHLVRATVRIATGYVAGEDLLAFAGLGNITGTWDAVTGTLRLTGIDTIANYEAALRAVTYQNVSDQPSTVLRHVEFIADDGVSESAPVARTIQVSPLNDQPLAANDAYVVSQGVVLDVSSAAGVLSNDSDPDADPLRATLLVGPQSGTLTLAPTGDFVYLPDDGFVGLDSFTYEADDGSASSTVATVEIEVLPVFQPPDPPEEGEAEEDQGDPTEEAESEEDENLLEGDFGRNTTDRRDNEVAESRESIDFRQITTDSPSDSAFVATTSLTVTDPESDLTDIHFSIAASSQPLAINLRELQQFGQTQVAALVAYTDISLLEQLEHISKQLDVNFSLPRWMIDSVAFSSSVGFSAGYVIWSLRSGYMLASVLSSMPAWTLVDPLPVLQYLDDEEEDDGESLESIIAG